MTPILANDRDWTSVDGRVCRVTRFTALAKFESGKVVSTDRSTPYAFVALEAVDLPRGTLGAITHKLDFEHLWAAFVERGVADDEEVIIFWLKREKLKGLSRLFSPFMPGLAVMVCKAGAWELLADPNCQPELTGKARYLAEMPLMHWAPEPYR